MRYYPRIYSVEDLLARTTEADRAYLAGLIDGEGTICVFSNFAQGYYRFILRTNIYNTHEPVLHWVKARFGGRVGPVRRKPSENHLPQFIWEGGAQQSTSMLRVIRRYMIIKATQADLFLEIADMHSRRRVNRNKSPEMIARELEISKEISRLNRPNKEVLTTLPTLEELFDD